MAPPRFVVLNESPDFSRAKKSRRTCGSPLSSDDEFDFEPRKRAKVSNQRPTKQHKTKKTVANPPPAKPKQLASLNKRKTEAPSPKFVWYLLHCLKESVQSKLSFDFGFGQGSIVPLPSSSEWTSEQTDLFAQWLETLGFTSRPTVNSVVYRISNKEALAIVQTFSSQLSSNPSTSDTNALLSQMKAPIEDENLIIVAAPKEESPKTERDGFENYTRRTNPSRRRPPPSLMWGSPIQPDQTQAQPPRLSVGSIDFNPPKPNRLSISSIPEESPQEYKESPLDNSVDSLDLDDIQEPAPRHSITKRLSFGGFLTAKTKSKRLSIDSIVEESSFDLLNMSRENAAVQTKKARNHLRRLSRFETVKSDRRMSIFLPKYTYTPLKETTKAKPPMPDAVSSLFLSSQMLEIVPTLSLVSKQWRKITNEVSAWKRADYHAQPVQENIEEVYRDMPWGQYLSDGAYKQVFKVYSVDQGRYEAVSVMDIRHIEAIGNENIVRQEIAHSLLFSHLVDSGFCPNFLRIHSVFLMPTKPKESLWGSPDCPMPQGSMYTSTINKNKFTKKGSTGSGLYQYMRMELCDGGNVEDYLRVEECPCWQSFFFQMVFALYVGREQHQLRHYDVKLLNFFLQSTNNDTKVSYAFEDLKFELSTPYWVKLADYGTADTESSSLGQPIGIEHFTTLENAPIEFFLHGDAAVQGYAIDAFALGISLLHLLTGRAPYEEILEDVVCPPSLQTALLALWKKKRSASSKASFTIMQRLLQDKSNVSVLCDTLYRYCVLFGLNQLNANESSVSALLLQQLTLGSKRHPSAAQFQYDADCALYSLACGTHEALRDARSRLETVPGAMTTLLSLVDFDPKQRPSLYSLLKGPLFASLQAKDNTKTVTVRTYARPEGELLIDV
ncbi:hypothetical protein AC1031_012171 [Aphanomyces cochlioides]|nr:hypothetical protein AC1031_012171 [Aphanomyces cochlioides]